MAVSSNNNKMTTNMIHSDEEREAIFLSQQGGQDLIQSLLMKEGDDVYLIMNHQ
jgi:homospermidine synthase